MAHLADLLEREIILPYTAYEGLIEVSHFVYNSYNRHLTFFQMCKSRNFLDWMCDLENILKLKSISLHLLSIAIANDVVIEHVQDYAAREIANSSTCMYNCLFIALIFLTIHLKRNRRYFGETPP